MNELEVLARWNPTGLDPRALDHEAKARAQLDAVTVPAPAPSRRSAPRRLVGRAVVAALVTGAVAVGAVVVVTRMVDDHIDHIRRARVPAGALDGDATGRPTTVLVVGTDSRRFVTSERQARAFGNPAQVPGERSDTVILVRFSAASVQAVWLPRDLLVDDGRGGTAQLNSFMTAGPTALIDAVRRSTGEPIDHYVQVDFPGFAGAVAETGGIRIDVPRPVRDEYSGLRLGGDGCTRLDGPTALAWARSRHLEELDGGAWVDISRHADLDRIARQQELLLAAATQVRTRVGDDVGAAVRLADAVTRHLVVDASMTREQVEELVGFAMRTDRYELATAPTVPDPGQPGRLRLVDRGAGEDFLTWATEAGALTTGTGATSGTGGISPGLGHSC
ncbi:MAG: LCP family protein [Acidimicrobiia bacterium]